MTTCEHEINYCPNCRFDLTVLRQATSFMVQKERMKIYEEVRAELESQDHKEQRLSLVPQARQSVKALPLPSKTVAKSKRVDITPEIIERVRQLRELRHNDKRLPMKDLAKQAKVPVATANYIVYFLLKKTTSKQHQHQLATKSSWV